MYGNKNRPIVQVDNKEVKEQIVEVDDRLSSQLAQTEEKKADRNEVQSGLNLKRDKSVPISLNDTSPELLAAIEGGEGTTFNIESIPRDKSVSPKKTTFIKTSSNLYNHNTSIIGKQLESSTGNVVDNLQYTTSDFIEVKPSTPHTYRKINRVIYYNSNKEYISVFNFADVEVGSTRTTPASCAFIRVHGFNANMPTAQINEGDTLLEYEPFYEHLTNELLNDVDGYVLKDNSVDIKKIKSIEKSPNLFNPNKAFLGYSLHSQTGQLQENSGYTSSDWINIERDSYSLKGFNRVLWYNSDKERIGFSDFSSDGATINPINNAVYFRVHGFSNNMGHAQINEGENLLPYENFYISIEGIKINDTENEDNTEDENEKAYYFPPDNLLGEFVAKDGEYQSFMELNDLYSAYDVLINNNPEYFTKTLLGKDESGQYDIYEYHLKPKEVNSDVTKKQPKIIFINNIHGHERSGTFATYYMVKALCEDWKNDPILEYLRWNVEFVFIPVLNPWGFVTGEYKNSNGVNIQTNFPTNWSSEGNRGDPDNPSYGGPNPLSEVETQYAKQMIDNHTDALHFMDNHTADFTDLSTGTLFYCMNNLIAGEFDMDIEVSAKYWIEKMSRYLFKHYDYDYGILGRIDKRTGRGTADTYTSTMGIPSVVLEFFYRLPDETEFYSSKCLKANTEFLINWIIIVLRRFKDVYYK